MNLTYSAKIAIICGVFLTSLLVSLSFDIALSLSFSLYFLFFQKNFPPIFVVSLLLFLADIFYRNSELHFRFITDLTIDSYILFLTAVVIYLKSRSDFTQMVSRLNKGDKKLFSPNRILQLLISLVFTMLFFPIFGGYLAAILGYILYSYLTRQFNGKIAVVLALFFLVITAFFLVIKKNVIAEILASYIYLFIVIGTVQEVINLVRQRKIDDRKLPEKQIEQLHERINLNFPGFNFPKINLRIVLPAFIILILLLLLYFLYPVISKSSSSFKMPIINFLKKAPTPTSLPIPTILPSPSIAPTPITQVSTSTALLKVMVLNGTEIFGLASTTSAKLKKVGFQNVVIANAQKSDYKTWEILFKKNDEDIVGIIKNILGLDTLSAKEASAGAGYDIEIIAGEKR